MGRLGASRSRKSQNAKNIEKTMKINDFGLLGPSLEASWRSLGASWRSLRASWSPRGASWRRFGASWTLLGTSRRPHGASSVRGLPLEPLLGPSPGAFWAVLGGSWAVWGPSWAALGGSWAVWGPSWAVLGASWGPLGPSWSGLGSLLGGLGASESRNSEKAKNIEKTNENQRFGTLGPSWAASSSLLGRLGGPPGQFKTHRGPLETPGGGLGSVSRPSGAAGTAV